MSLILKTMVPQLCDLNLASSKYILQNYSNYLEYLNTFVNEIETALKYRDTFFKNDSVGERINFFNNLQEKFDKFNDDFVSYWYEIYKTSPDYIKSKVKIDTLNLDSDSIGKFTNSTYILDDSVCPVSDWNMNSAPPPSYVPYNAVNKLSPWQKQIIERASYRTNNMYRCNITLVQPKDARPTEAHGVNLVTDELYYTRTVSEIKKKTAEKLLNTFKKEIKYIVRYCNVNDNQAINYQDPNINKSFISQYTFELDIEQVRYLVDVLSNRIKYVKSRIASDTTLSTEKIATIKAQQKTTEQLDNIYKNNLVTRLDALDPRTFFNNIFNTEKSKNKLDSKFKETSNSDKERSNVTNEAELSQAKTTQSQKAVPSSNFNHYPGNVSYPTYQAPQWAQDLAGCLGVGAALDIFSGAVDPLTQFANLSSTNFDLFGELSKINPFGISFAGFTTDLDQSMQNLLQSINSFDLSQIPALFNVNLPIPPFSLGTLFDKNGIAGDLKDISLKKIQDQALAMLKEQSLAMLNNLVCGTAKGFTGGSNFGGGFGI